MKVSKKAIVQYFLIYLMLLTNGTYFYYKIISNYQVIFVAFFVGMMLLCRRLRHRWSAIAVLGLFAFVIILRYTIGGVGINIYFTWIINILSASTAFFYDKTNFIKRFVKLVSVFAFFSLFFFLLSQINLEIAEQLLVMDFQYEAGNETTMINGMFVYSINPWHLTRNTSIYIEPGVYQIVLNSALFLMLFCKHKIEVKENTLNRMIVLMLLVIATCQSTTGYIATLCVFIGYLFINPHGEMKTRRKVLAIFAIATVLLGVEYFLNGEESILHANFFSKLANDGNIDLNVSSGKYRMMTIELSLLSLLQKPLGVGYTVVSEMMEAQKGAVGAQLLRSAAACGLPWLIFVLVWLFVPVVKSKCHWAVKLVVTLLYINIALAQSQEFYPAIMVLIYVLGSDLCPNRRKESELKGNENIMVYK